MIKHNLAAGVQIQETSIQDVTNKLPETSTATQQGKTEEGGFVCTQYTPLTAACLVVLWYLFHYSLGLRFHD